LDADSRGELVVLLIAEFVLEKVARP
jgi:hypothetical protein